MRYLCGRLGHGLLVLLGVSVLSFLLAEAAPGSVVDELKLNPRISPVDHRGHARPLRPGSIRSREILPLAPVHRARRAGVLRGLQQSGRPAALAARTQHVVSHRAGDRARLADRGPARHLGGQSDRAAGPIASPRARRPRCSASRTCFWAWVFCCWPSAPAISRRAAWSRSALPTSVRGTRSKDVLSHFFLPVTALTLINLPVLVRHVRASMIDVLQAPFIQAGRAMGISERRLLFRYALRAAANPLISLLGLSVAALLSASLVVETIMSWPGLGPLLLAAVVARDLHVVVGVVTCSTLLLIAGNLLADGLLYLADPRIRPGQGCSRRSGALGRLRHARIVRRQAGASLQTGAWPARRCLSVDALRRVSRAGRSRHPEPRSRVRSSDAPPLRRRDRPAARAAVRLRTDAPLRSVRGIRGGSEPHLPGPLLRSRRAVPDCRPHRRRPASVWNRQPDPLLSARQRRLRAGPVLPVAVTADRSRCLPGCWARPLAGRRHAARRAGRLLRRVGGRDHHAGRGAVPRAAVAVSAVCGSHGACRSTSSRRRRFCWCSW